MWLGVLILWAAEVSAASLDAIEVCGMWGSPATTDASSVWWNPAGLAIESGTHITLEGAPTFAELTFDREHRFHAGEERYRYATVAPCAAIDTSLGIENLGVGAALVVPMGAGLTSAEEFGPGAFALQDGQVGALYGMLGAAYHIADTVSVGASVSVVASSYKAQLYSVGMMDMADEIASTQGVGTTELDYGASVLEDPDYNPQVTFGPLSGMGVTFGAGVYVTPTPWLGIAVSYVHGWSITHEGTVDVQFDCPPQDDAVGRFAFESQGLCGQSASSDGAITYSYPSRVHFGVAVHPVDRLRLEVMGAWVGWSVFDNYHIQTSDPQGETLTELSRQMLSQDRYWARDNQDSFWVGLDGRVDVTPKVTLGSRFIYESAAVPAVALSPNNYDSDAIYVSGLVAGRFIRELEFGLSYTHRFWIPRHVSGGVYSVALDPVNRVEDRYRWPSMDGSYSGWVARIGVSVRGHFN